MIGRIVRLALIALLVATGVHLWYGRVGERLLAWLPAPSPGASGPALAPDRPAAAGVAPAKVDTRVILSRNIFKAALEAEEPSAGGQEVDLDALEETRMQLVLLGILGEYLGRLFLTANRKPQSLVREVVPPAAERRDDD